MFAPPPLLHLQLQSEALCTSAFEEHVSVCVLGLKNNHRQMFQNKHSLPKERIDCLLCQIVERILCVRYNSA